MSPCRNDSEQINKEQIDELENIVAKLPDDEVLNSDTDLLKALADPTRLKIIYLLRYGELCVCEINFALNKPQPTISHHLNILKKAGVLNWRKEGVWIHYSLKNLEILNLIDELTKLSQ